MSWRFGWARIERKGKHTRKTDAGTGRGRDEWKEMEK